MDEGNKEMGMDDGDDVETWETVEPPLGAAWVLNHTDYLARAGVSTDAIPLAGVRAATVLGTDGAKSYTWEFDGTYTTDDWLAMAGWLQAMAMDCVERFMSEFQCVQIHKDDDAGEGS